MDVVVSVVTNILNKLANEAILQASYPFRFNNYVKELEKEKEDLQSKIQKVLDRAKDAEKKTHKVVGEVEKWLNEANSLMAEVVKLQEKSKKRNKMSCLNHCPDLISRYNLAKKLAKKMDKINKHNQVEFLEFSRLSTLVGMDYFSSQDFVQFESRKVAYDVLLRALQHDRIHKIGLYGMGGSGKTTLVTEVGKEAEKFFDKVLFVVVSNTFDVRKLQSKIASQLSLELKEEETLERAKRLFMRLSGGEKLLIILDDVWEKLNFVDIGIPIDNNHQKGCTTLITTRNFYVCKLMNCQEVIHLEGLNEDESWALFQKHAGLFDDQFVTLKDIAQKITKECDGLPIAIAAVASALKDKPRGEWIEALKTLRDPSWMDIEEGLKGTYRCLRLSYDNLENEVSKSLFLFCSVYPEDYEIRIDQLTIIGLGLGLSGEIPSHQRFKTKVIKQAIQKLIDSCLLLKVHEDDEDEGHVKMHDLVRDLAQWIAKKENKLIMEQSNEGMMMNDHEIRYLWFQGVDKCPSKLSCPELEFLCVSAYSEPYVTIPNDFLSGMEKLRILILENPTMKRDLALQLPISLHLVNNLRCLMLYSWVLGDISFIESLERLESLTMRRCSFDELPKGIIKQKKLRLLDLRGCNIQRNPFEVMGCCSQLEVLYFCGNRGTNWEKRKNNSAEFFDKINTTAPALESFCIHFYVTHEFHIESDLMYRYTFDARNLYIEDFENCISVATSKDMMRRAKTLSLRGIPGSLRNIIPDLWQTVGGGLNELTELALLDSDGIESVIGHVSNPSQVRIISNLTHLTLGQVKHLKSLYLGQPPHGLFANLEYLCIYDCDSFEHIIAEDVKEIVDGSDCQSYGNAFPKLKTLETINCKKVEYLIPISFAKGFVHLEWLIVDGNDEIRSLFGQSLYEDLNLNKPQIIEFSGMKHLHLHELPNIVSICPENYHPTWPCLNGLQLKNCPRLNIKSINHWVACGGMGHEDDQMTSEELLKVVVAPLETLQTLSLFNDEAEVVFDVENLLTNEQQVNSSARGLVFVNLPQLRHIWRGPKNSLLLQHLERLRLLSCGNLKVVFPSFILKSLPRFRELYIIDCNELEKIIEEDDQNVSNSRELIFPRLVAIYVKQCHKLKYVFPKMSVCQVIPNLRVLTIQDASKLEQAFSPEQLGTTYTYEVVIPALEYVLLWNLPSLASVAPSIALQNVRYIVVQQCPKLSLTSSVTPQELHKQLSKGYLDERYLLKSSLEDIIKSMNDSSIKTTEQIDCQETGDHSNEEKLTFLALPNLTENKEKSEDRSTNKRDMLEEKSNEVRDEEYTTPNNAHITLTHLKQADSTKDVKGNIEGSPSYEIVEIITPSNHSELASLFTSSTNTIPHIQGQINHREIDVDKYMKDTSITNLQDLKDDDLISLLQSLEDDYDDKSPMLSVPNVNTAKDEPVSKALADLEDSLKMPLKEIATSETNCLRLQTALNFLSRLSLEDGALPHEVMAIIKSMNKDLPTILSCFNQAFAAVNKFEVLQERDKSIKGELAQRKAVAVALVSKMSETQKFMDEAQEKEARLKKQIYKLEKERKDCEDELLSLQEQKRKYIAEAIEFKNEIETVKKDKSEMVEDQRNARQQLFQADYKWSVLGSQFEQHIANKNLS